MQDLCPESDRRSAWEESQGEKNEMDLIKSGEVVVRQSCGCVVRVMPKFIVETVCELGQEHHHRLPHHWMKHLEPSLQIKEKPDGSDQ